MVLVSLILPIKNQSTQLKENFSKLYQELKSRYGDNFEIIIVESGSSDNSKDETRKFLHLRHVRAIFERENGKGKAVRSGIYAAKGKVVGFMDMDLSVQPRYIEYAVARVMEGNKIVIASRYMKGSRTTRHFSRLLFSFLYNTLLMAAFGSKVDDHQCGFKFFDAAYAKGAVRKVKDNGWFFDAELLINAQREGIMPLEMPVYWSGGERKTATMLPDMVYLIKAMVKYRMRRG